MPRPHPDGVSGYAERTLRHVPGLRDMHRMSGLLLAEHVPSDGRILVLGAGGGLELAALAEMQPDWRFCGVDPSPEMLSQARSEMGVLESRAQLILGYIDDAPEGPFDGATCLLTLHFLSESERLKTLRHLYDRLRPGAPLVVAHHSFPTEGVQMDRWLARYSAFAGSSNISTGQAERSIAVMKERLPVLSPEEDVALLAAAGFQDVELFYAGFTFKGWVSYRP